MNAVEKRTAESMRANFITCPNDRFIIPIIRNCLSDSMTIIVKNNGRDEDFRIGCKNHLPVWELLRDLDNMGGRYVFIQIDDEPLIPFKKSMPYKARFEKHSL